MGDEPASAESDGKVETDTAEKTVLNEAETKETSDSLTHEVTTGQTEEANSKKEANEVEEEKSGETVPDAAKEGKTEDQTEHKEEKDASEDPELPLTENVKEAQKETSNDTGAEIEKDAVQQNEPEITPVESIQAPEPLPSDEAPEVSPAENLTKPGLDDDKEQNLTIKPDDLIPEDVVSDVSSVEMVQGATLGSVSFVNKNTIVILFSRV